MKKLLLGLLAGFVISVVGYNLNLRLTTEVMTVVEVRYNQGVFGYNHGFFEYWANNEKTGDSYHGITFSNKLRVGQKVRVNR